MTRLLLPRGDTRGSRTRNADPDATPLSVLSAALVLALGLAHIPAHALTMGRLQVQSALGEPLRAEIDVADISAVEADSLRVGIAPVSAFNAAGVSYSSALSDVRVALQRRADGRYVVRVNGTRPLNDPFLDVLLEANWNGGRIVRDYTVLLDPPGHRQRVAASIAPSGPQLAAGARANPAPAPTAAGSPTAVVAPSSEAQEGRRQRATPQPATVAPAEARTSSNPRRQVTVRAGDTASRIAAANKPADISLDQMLVALLRANPDAFIGGNINRMKAGAVLDMPGSAQVGAIEPDEARRTVTAQSRDFNDYRSRLGQNAPTSSMAAADREATGRLQANVQDRSAAATSPDRLTLSQGGPGRADEQLTNARQARDNSARAAELTKNITDLNKVQAATGAAPSGSTPASSGAQAAPDASAPAAALPAATSPPAPGSAAPVGAPFPSAAAPGRAGGFTPGGGRRNTNRRRRGRTPACTNAGSAGTRILGRPARQPGYARRGSPDRVAGRVSAVPSARSQAY